MSCAPAKIQSWGNANKYKSSLTVAYNEKEPEVSFEYYDCKGKEKGHSKTHWHFKRRIYIDDKSFQTESLTVQERFFILAKNWKNETAGYAFLAKKINNINYLGIIGLAIVAGDPVIKLILQDLKNGVEHWHFALKKITDKNPVPREDIYDLEKIREHWLKWGEQNELI